MVATALLSFRHLDGKMPDGQNMNVCAVCYSFVVKQLKPPGVTHGLLFITFFTGNQDNIWKYKSLNYI